MVDDVYFATYWYGYCGCNGIFFYFFYLSMDLFFVKTAFGIGFIILISRVQKLAIFTLLMRKKISLILLSGKTPL